MKPDDFQRTTPIPLDDCGLAEVANILSDRWILLIVREVFYGVCRFEDIRQDLGIPKSVLTQRLKRLVEKQILVKMPYQEPGKRARFAYVLGEAGKGLLPLIVAATQWGDKYIRGGKPSLNLVEDQTDKPIQQGFVCEGKSIPVENIRLKLPG